MPYRRPTKTLLRTTILLLLAAVMLVACGQEAPQTTLNPQTESSRTIYDLSIYLFWLGVGVFIVVEGWLIVSIEISPPLRRSIARPNSRQHQS